MEWYYSEKDQARCVGRAKIVNRQEPDAEFEMFYNIQSPLKHADEKSCSRIITLGGHANGSKTFEGDIHCLEYYRVSHNDSIYAEHDSTVSATACFREAGMEGLLKKEPFPQPLRSLIKFDIMMSD